ncbi:hypothetical protein HFP89_08610 [Wenzhouxiangella sp. XN79A]|uniref:hypothetical protein n=1 Tax=Wenzhouxiangella sp. XN79A TaxID=2724193 RepID=UPI00144A756E|nr:hypothetical protein [Wenzhouxiangella sp. XN79A]NKI35226.1 hypothetical protein [Wenzhouxiangella sp. XN79A]
MVAVSEMTGGKFANGALTAAMQFSVKQALTFDRGLTDAERTRGALANAAYGRDLPKGWEMREWFLNEESGFQAMLVINEELGESALVFTGTNQGIDWLHNFRQGLGMVSQQYEQAMALGSRFKDSVHYVGQSLGGGLAQAAAIAAGGSATVFNSAGVNPRTVRGHDPSKASITHIYSSYDVLQPVNILTPGRIYGEQVRVGAAGWHPMPDMCRGIGC